jgi:hypothetical protein
LTFGTYFNQKVDVLPSSLQSLTFDRYFNQKVYNLPSSLQSLVFGPNFNQNVDNLPLSLKSLTFQGIFNQKLNNLENLSSLEHLILPFNYKLTINLYQIPQTLKTIVGKKTININELRYKFS